MSKAMSGLENRTICARVQLCIFENEHRIPGHSTAPQSRRFQWDGLNGSVRRKISEVPFPSAAQFSQRRNSLGSNWDRAQSSCGIYISSC
jgi:hypothetical protein